MFCLRQHKPSKDFYITHKILLTYSNLTFDNVAPNATDHHANLTLIKCSKYVTKLLELLVDKFLYKSSPNI